MVACFAADQLAFPRRSRLLIHRTYFHRAIVVKKLSVRAALIPFL